VAIDLAGGAATGSFRSSLETLAGDNDLEITASGGIPEAVVGTLATLPYSIRVSPRIDDYTAIADTKQSLPLIGLDLVTEASAYAQNESQITSGAQGISASKRFVRASRRCEQHLGGREHRVQSRRPRRTAHQRSSQRLHGAGRVPRFKRQRIRYRDGHCDCATGALAVRPRRSHPLEKCRRLPSLEDWQQRLRAVLPAGVEVRPQGTGTTENRRMLAAFPLEFAPAELYLSRCRRFS